MAPITAPTNRNKDRRWKENRRWAVVLAVCLFALHSGIIGSFAQPALPTPPGELLNAYHFNDTNWLSLWGYAPKAATGLALVSSWEQNAVQISGTNALLQYNSVETN